VNTVRLSRLNGKHVERFERTRRAAGQSLFYVMRVYPGRAKAYGEFHRKDIAYLFNEVGCRTRTVLVCE
jgi:hypothetical protein